MKITRKRFSCFRNNLSTLIFLYFLFQYSSVFSQNIEWEISLGGSSDDYNYSICQTLDSGYLVVGCTASNDGDVVGFHPGNCTSGYCYDMWVVKLSRFGNIEWSKSLGGSMMDYGVSAVLSGSGYLIAGNTFSNDGDVSGNNGSSDAWIVKLDSTGGILWQKCIGGTDADGFNSIIELNDHSIVAFGATYSNDIWVHGNHGDKDFWLVKMDSAANVIWQHCYGGSGRENSFSMKQTSDGGYVLCGFTDSDDGQPNIPFNRGRQYWVVKTDSAGNMLWNNNFGGTLDDWCTDVVETNDNGFVLTGFALSVDYDVTNRHDHLYDDGWVVKIDSIGNLVWQHAMGGTSGDEFYTILHAEDSSFVTVGFTMSNDDDVNGNHSVYQDNWFVQFSDQGVIQSQKCFGGPYSDECLKIIQTNDHGFALSCNTYGPGFDVSNFHGGHTDFWVAKLGSIINSIPETSLEGITFFPNPASDFIYTEKVLIPQSINIYSLSGEIIKHFELKFQNEKLDISDLVPGVYFLRTEDGAVSKLLKY